MFLLRDGACADPCLDDGIDQENCPAGAGTENSTANDATGISMSADVLLAGHGLTREAAAHCPKQ